MLRAKYDALSDRFDTVQLQLQECSALKAKAEAATEEVRGEAAQLQRRGAAQEAELEELRRGSAALLLQLREAQDDALRGRQEAALRGLELAGTDACLKLVREEATEAVGLAQYHGHAQLSELRAQVCLIPRAPFNNSAPLGRGSHTTPLAPPKKYLAEFSFGSLADQKILRRLFFGLFFFGANQFRAKIIFSTSKNSATAGEGWW